MIKFILSTVIAITIACIYSYNANAKAVNLVDYDWGLPGGSDSLEPINCEEACPGYFDYITFCQQGYSLISCNDPRCYEYKKCVIK